MKQAKVILIALVTLFTTSLFAQKTEKNQEKKDQPKHEIGIDFLDLSKYRKIELSYNYLYNKSNSFGTTLYFFENNPNFWKEKGYQEILGVSFNYRHYFSKKYAQGFYVEAFAKYEFGHRYNISRPDLPIFRNDYHVINAGLGVGYKHVTKSNIYFDLNIRLDQTIVDFRNNGIESYLLSYPNGGFNYGFTIGKRF